jgi:hypothetical protein
LAYYPIGVFHRAIGCVLQWYRLSFIITTSSARLKPLTKPVNATIVVMNHNVCHESELNPQENHFPVENQTKNTVA